MHETRQPASRWGYDIQKRPALVEPLCDDLIETLREMKERDAPFFISAGCVEPHRLGGPDEHHYIGFIGKHMQPDDTKGVVVPGYLEDNAGVRTELAELQGAVKHVDFHFGRVLDALDDLGLTDDTLVVFTADHGIAMPRAKCSCYDPGLEIALILRLPSRSGWNGGRVVDALAPNTDLTPSLCEVAGAPVPESAQGRSWTPLLDGGEYMENEAFFPELSYHSYYDPIRAVRTRRHKLMVFFSAAPSFMDPEQSWIPRTHPKTPAEPALTHHPDIELYDIDADPWEQENLVDDPACAVMKRELMQRLYRHLVATDDPILQGAITPPIHGRMMELLGNAAKNG